MASQADNAALARALRELAARFAEQGNVFGARGFAKAAGTVERLSRPVLDIWCAGGLAALTALPCVGKSIALWLVEALASGHE